MSGQGRLTELEGFPSPGDVTDLASLSEQEILEILSRDGWREIEFELFVRNGMTLTDVELACRRLLMERNPR